MSRKLFGCVVMTLDGVSLWQGWLFKPSAKLQTKPLCLAVAQVFTNQKDQDSSFITTGPYAVASANKLSQQTADDLAKLISNTNMLQLFQLCYDPSEYTTEDDSARKWVSQHGKNERLETFFTAKLQLISPCEDCFTNLSQVSGFQCCHFADLSGPSQVLLSYWPEQSGNGSVMAMLRDTSSSLWTLLLDEGRSLLEPEQRSHNCTMDLSPFGQAGLKATMRHVHLRDYDPAFVVVYKDPSVMVAGTASNRRFQVSHEEDIIPEQVMQQLDQAERMLLLKFPSSRRELLEIIWPALCGQPGSKAGHANTAVSNKLRNCTAPSRSSAGGGLPSPHSSTPQTRTPSPEPSNEERSSKKAMPSGPTPAHPTPHNLLRPSPSDSRAVDTHEPLSQRSTDGTKTTKAVTEGRSSKLKHVLGGFFSSASEKKTHLLVSTGDAGSVSRVEQNVRTLPGHEDEDVLQTSKAREEALSQEIKGSKPRITSKPSWISRLLSKPSTTDRGTKSDLITNAKARGKNKQGMNPVGLTTVHSLQPASQIPPSSQLHAASCTQEAVQVMRQGHVEASPDVYRAASAAPVLETAETSRVAASLQPPRFRVESIDPGVVKGNLMLSSTSGSAGSDLEEEGNANYQQLHQPGASGSAGSDLEEEGNANYQQLHQPGASQVVELSEVQQFDADMMPANTKKSIHYHSGGEMLLTTDLTGSQGFSSKPSNTPLQIPAQSYGTSFGSPVLQGTVGATHGSVRSTGSTERASKAPLSQQEYKDASVVEPNETLLGTLVPGLAPRSHWIEPSGDVVEDDHRDATWLNSKPPIQEVSSRQNVALRPSSNRMQTVHFEHSPHLPTSTQPNDLFDRPTQIKHTSSCVPAEATPAAAAAAGYMSPRPRPPAGAPSASLGGRYSLGPSPPPATAVSGRAVVGRYSLGPTPPAAAAAAAVKLPVGLSRGNVSGADAPAGRSLPIAAMTPQTVTHKALSNPSPKPSPSLPIAAMTPQTQPPTQTSTTATSPPRMLTQSPRSRWATLSPPAKAMPGVVLERDADMLLSSSPPPRESPVTQKALSNPSPKPSPHRISSGPTASKQTSNLSTTQELLPGSQTHLFTPVPPPPRASTPAYPKHPPSVASAQQHPFGSPKPSWFASTSILDSFASTAANNLDTLNKQSPRQAESIDFLDPNQGSRRASLGMPFQHRRLASVAAIDRRLSLGQTQPSGIERQQHRLWENLSIPLHHQSLMSLQAEEVRQRVSRWDLQLQKEREMRDWLTGGVGADSGQMAFASGLPLGGAKPKSVGSMRSSAGGVWMPGSTGEVPMLASRGVGSESAVKPSAVWQLFDGQWHRLLPDGTWLPMLAGPMAVHVQPSSSAQSNDDVQENDGKEKDFQAMNSFVEMSPGIINTRGDNRGRVGGKITLPGERIDINAEVVPLESSAGATLTATAAVAPVAASIMANVLQNLTRQLVQLQGLNMSSALSVAQLPSMPACHMLEGYFPHDSTPLYQNPSFIANRKALNTTLLEPEVKGDCPKDLAQHPACDNTVLQEQRDTVLQESQGPLIEEAESVAVQLGSLDPNSAEVKDVTSINYGINDVHFFRGKDSEVYCNFHGRWYLVQSGDDSV
ncbi:hypothetical protein CEUSTIGMA_g12922.t1 [Chlamydomonas eustigma]|uniref:Uncharacterized protein n=1 Tax=Chlamydomonas eustigma TaxID=1157962 RepID=A0A250XR31_9CHLO|nr:hypothetical protein CEUSTIGMA_g12922.t1 [Chlamydomonas eustigma]|eukprot:GAX85506.1 hypothetical protein CEUSTIGMA_g12922.t1 [Chlamydomonas eustigma]